MTNQRKKRARAKIFGREGRPRLSVFRSGKHIYAQIIDDVKGKTLVSSSTKKLLKEAKGKARTQAAMVVGEDLAKIAKGKKISKIVFDRAGYKYHGRVKNLAEGARKGGLEF